MSEFIIDSDAHNAAAQRMIDADGAVFAAFDGLDCGFDHAQVLDYLMGMRTFAELPVELQGKFAGAVMACAMTLVESDRARR
jgi:hypothetical protein